MQDRIDDCKNWEKKFDEDYAEICLEDEFERLTQTYPLYELFVAIGYTYAIFEKV